MRCPSLTDLPPPPEGTKGWPWTEETPRLPTSMPDGKPWPRISIVTPSYNQGQFIEETIRSVLLQGYPDLEYIIMDGGSTDESVEIILKYESWITFWVSESDSGQTNAINKGFKRSTGEIVAWLNSDDLYTAGAFCIAAKAFAERPGVAVIYGDLDVIDGDTEVLSQSKSRKYNLEELYRGNYILQPASFIKASAVEDVGFLDERFHYSMDYDLWFRLGQGGAIMQYIPKTLAQFRKHGSSKTVSQQGSFWPENIMALDMALKRDVPKASFARAAYSRLFQLLVFNYFSPQPQENLRYVNGGILDTGGQEALYHRPFQEILRFVSMNHPHPEDEHCLPEEVLHKIYHAFDEEYNDGVDSQYPDAISKWVNEQLIFLPNHLLSIGEKTKSVRVYIKVIRMYPSLLTYPQTYRFLAVYIAKVSGVFPLILSMQHHLTRIHDSLPSVK